MNKKLCPLMVVKYEKSYQKFECDREKCAWWDDFSEVCAILSIAQFGLSHVGIRKVEKHGR